MWKGPDLDPDDGGGDADGGTGSTNKNKIFLLFHQNHFDLLTAPAEFLKRKHFCLHCLKGYMNATEHRCNAVCRGCFRRHCTDKNNVNGAICCQECHRIFPGVICHAEHLVRTGPERPSLCERFRKCPDCGRVFKQRNRLYWRNRTHKCGELFCRSCKAYTDPGHLCYIKTVQEETEIRERLAEQAADNEDLGGDAGDGVLDAGDNLDEGGDDYGDAVENHIREMEAEAGDHPGPDLDEEQAFRKAKYMYFDIEAYPDAQQGGAHVCNLLIVQDNQSDQEWVFNDAHADGGPIGEFCTWAIQPAMKDTKLVAHNLKGYDGYFVVKWVLENSGLRMSVITNGSKLFMIELPDLNIRFIDSMNFLSTALAKLPAMFGFDVSGMKKGFFPHKFNRPGNFRYSGQMPAIHYYSPEEMSEGKRTEFMEWYQEKIAGEYRFKFRKELEDYCRDDVTILRECSERFRQCFFQETTVDPFKSVTIASACNRVFRKLFLPPHTIAIIPPDGYSGNNKQSNEALKWMYWQEHYTGMRINHIRNGGEVVVVTRTGQRLR